MQQEEKIKFLLLIHRDWVGVQCTRLSPKRMLALHSKWDAIALRDRGGVETPALLLIIPLALHEWIS